jgi:type 2 lantibiotic biosynthesis protein LanM
MEEPRAQQTGSELAPGWWVPALARHERPTGTTPGKTTSGNAAAGHATAGHATAGHAADARPAWCAVAEQAVALAAAPAELPDTDSWREAFAVPLRPFALLTQRQVAAAAIQHLGLGTDAAGSLAGTFTAKLPGQLARIALRTFVTEVGAANAEGRLVGADDRERFANYLRRLCTPAGLAGIFTRYPVLARLLATTVTSAADAGAELLARLASDRDAVVKTLLRDIDPGPVVAIEPGQGDSHSHGRSVTLVRFADGRTVVYKPRSLDTYAEFGKVVGWLNQRLGADGLRTASVLIRPGYGWMEFVQDRPLRRQADATRFYRRAGALLAALHALYVNDMHCENIIACGNQPVPIDAETILHPDLPLADNVTIPDPAAHALAASVRRTGLLPYFTVGENGLLDRSGLGGDPGATCPDAALDWDPPASASTRLVLRPATFPGTANRPRVGGQVTEPADYRADILDGFRLGYDAIVSRRADFARLIGSFSAAARVVVRPTCEYANLMDESTEPDLLTDALHRDQAFDVLDQASARHPMWQRLAPYERAAMWACDVPLVTAEPTATDLRTDAGGHLLDALERSGLRCALDQLAAMNEIDRGEQEWIIDASLATRRPARQHATARFLTSLTPANAEPERLLAASAGIADEIVARSTVLRGDGDQSRVNWLGMQLVDDEHWAVLPMGASLADGYLGVALFLAQLSELTGIVRYADTARRALSPVPQLLGALADYADVLGDVGCGMCSGLGGISYGLARLSTLLRDSRLTEWTAAAVRLTATAVDVQGQDGPAGWADGLAGCLAAMTAVHHETGLRAAADLAVSCADRLAGLVEEDALDASPGFAAGAAGIGYALAQFAASAPDSRHARAARRALRAAAGQIASSSGAKPGWCCGTSGLLGATVRPAGDRDFDGAGKALRVLAERPVLSDLSLRHGELGIADALTEPIAASEDLATRRAWRHHCDLILGAVQRHGPSCATPGGIMTPGLLDGLAGIGYGLLRLGFPDTVPSVLLLTP